MTNLTPPSNRSALLQARVRNGAGWFYWIAGLSALSMVINLFGGSYFSATGLGVISIAGFIAKEAGAIGIIICGIFSLFVIGIYVLFGVFAMKRHLWAFITGLVLYGLDTLLVLLFAILSHGSLLIALLIHVYAWYAILRGCIAGTQLSRLEEDERYSRAVYATSQAVPVMPVPPATPIMPSPPVTPYTAFVPDTLATPVTAIVPDAPASVLAGMQPPQC